MKGYGLALGLIGALAAGACSDDDQVTAPMTEQAFEVRVQNVSTVYAFGSSGAFDTPAGAAAPGPLLPGNTYEFRFSAAPGQRLSFATMFVQSNDWFYAPDGDGIALWDEAGNQVTGDVTDRVLLWDAGTEADEEPGLGQSQAPRQSGPDMGAADPDSNIRLVQSAANGVPAVSAVLRVTLTSTGATTWLARIENVSDGTTLATSDGTTHPVPLAPGVFVIHSAANPIFTVGEADRNEGLEALAEDGGATGLAAALAARTGLTSPLAPGVFAVHTAPSVLFRAGAADLGIGLEALAEDGSPSALAAALAGHMDVKASGAFDTPEGASGAGPAFPGDAYTFTFTAEPGDRLSFATMLVQSNDLFYAPAEAGLDLFPGGAALSGDVTGMVLLWDAGTEVNEEPGVGLSQAPRQSAAGAGTDESGLVRQVNDGYRYPDVGEVLRVTITPRG